MSNIQDNNLPPPPNDTNRTTSSPRITNASTSENVDTTSNQSTSYNDDVNSTSSRRRNISRLITSGESSTLNGRNAGASSSSNSSSISHNPSRNYINSNNANSNNNYNYTNNNVNNINNNRNTVNNVPILGVRDRLFHAMFFKASVTYARSVPSSIRRVIEFLILLKAVVAFFILVYVHTTFIHKPTECLSHLEGTWPRDGILRVEILKNGAADYTIENSYAKEKKLRQQRINEMNLLLTTFKFPMEWPSEVHLESSLEDDATLQETEKKDKDDSELFADEPIENVSSITWIDNNKSIFSSTWEDLKSFGGTRGFTKSEKFDKDIDASTGEFNETLLQQMAASNDGTNKEQSFRVSSPLKESVSEMEKLYRAVWPEEEYILEFSLEYGFLRLSPQVRQKMNIPVKIVTLDPAKDTCFGDRITRLILEHLIGYDDLLMVSIKTLAEKENNKGFLRNVVTGEHYRFVTMWMSRASYLFAFGIMIVFTLSISMLLRYSHHQIFVFIVDLLQMLEFNTAISFPAAPLLTVILALIGMEAVMSEFFNDTTTAFYIILIVWISDQYEAVCCHRPVTKKHWIRFFYLYHFSFYAYHYRFNGQYSGLALITSWLFIEHSMVYFYHHYELPAVLQRHHLQQFILAQQTAANGDSVTFLNSDHNNEGEVRNANASGGAQTFNDDSSVDLQRTHEEMQSIFSNITRRLRFRRRTNVSESPDNSANQTSTMFYANQQLTRNQYMNEESSSMINIQEVNSSTDTPGRPTRKTSTPSTMNSSFSPDIIASTSKNVISSPDVVTSSSTENTIAGQADDGDSRRALDSDSFDSQGSTKSNDMRIASENMNDTRSTCTCGDDTAVRLES